METSPKTTQKKITAQAPGRINIIGEHTDYNDGFVLPAAIDKKIEVTILRNFTPGMANLLDRKGQISFSFNLENFSPQGNGWHNYVMGVVHELQKLGSGIEGFDAEFEGDVPIGSGMSSSAALECSFAVALNSLFDLGLDNWQLIKASQMAEHHFVGTKCGIMDQFASVMGKKGHAMLLDCRSLEFRYAPIELGDFQLLLLNTNVSHSLASSEYNTRREECGEAIRLVQAKHPSITSLRDVTLEMLHQCASIMPKNIFKRGHHVIHENNRVLAAADALSKKDFQQVGKLMYQSHHSLQNDYEVSCPELDFLVQLATQKDYVIGSRMMGGGFGGCTINMVEKSRASEFVEQASEAYFKQFGISPTPIHVAIGDGARVV